MRPGFVTFNAASCAVRKFLVRTFLLSALAVVPACAHLPEIDPDLACNIPTQTEAQAITVMRKESVQLTGTPFVDGNKVDLLENGPVTYAAMETAIGSAKQRIDMESYEFDGQIAERFAQLLAAKHRQGVQVDLVYDDYGTKAPTGLFDGLRGAGVNVVTYSPFDPAKMTSLDLNKRDHRKLLIVDGSTVFTGGINIAQVYENHRAPYMRGSDPAKLPWRDTDVKIEGPVAERFRAAVYADMDRAEGAPHSAAATDIHDAAGGFGCAGAGWLAS